MSASDNTENGLYKKRDELKEKIRATQEKILATRQRMEDGKETLIALAKERTQSRRGWSIWRRNVPCVKCILSSRCRMMNASAI